MKNTFPRFPQRKKSSFLLIFPHLLFIAALLWGYYYIWQHNYFYNYLAPIYIGVKIVIACDIFIASIGTILMPILALIAGIGIMYLRQDFIFSIHSSEWQLVMMSVIGFFIRFLAR
ncbi:MAG: hypothetical protein JO131_05125 [Gammaproteobacteria bacterium]|nr:hypothetical protein [Gammaproteobacteria bacterium]